MQPYKTLIAHYDAANTLWSVRGGSITLKHAASLVTAGVALAAKQLLQDGSKDVFDILDSKFEKAILKAALEVTRGRRVEAAERLGIGRNTITRKLQELGIDD